MLKFIKSPKSNTFINSSFIIGTTLMSATFMLATNKQHINRELQTEINNICNVNDNDNDTPKTVIKTFTSNEVDDNVWLEYGGCNIYELYTREYDFNRKYASMMHPTYNIDLKTTCNKHLNNGKIINDCDEYLRFARYGQNLDCKSTFTISKK